MAEPGLKKNKKTWKERKKIHERKRKKKEGGKENKMYEEFILLQFYSCDDFQFICLAPSFDLNEYKRKEWTLDFLTCPTVLLA